MQQYELDTFGKSHDLMSNFWNSCFDDLMSTAQRRDKDRSDCKNKFQVSVHTVLQGLIHLGFGIFSTSKIKCFWLHQNIYATNDSVLF